MASRVVKGSLCLQWLVTIQFLVTAAFHWSLGSQCARGGHPWQTAGGTHCQHSAQCGCMIEGPQLSNEPAFALGIFSVQSIIASSALCAACSDWDKAPVCPGVPPNSHILPRRGTSQVRNCGSQVFSDLGKGH